MKKIYQYFHLLIMFLMIDTTIPGLSQGLFSSFNSAALHIKSPSYTLCPVRELTALAVTNAAYLTWTKPQCVVGLVGYNVYRNYEGTEIFHHFVPGPDSIKTFVFNLNCGLTCFDIRAKYDLSVFGYPGTFGESIPQDPCPACVYLIYGLSLPFYEPWDGGSLGYQQWTAESNWIYQVNVGYPFPCAEFKGQPELTNYSSSLTGPPCFDVNLYVCANLGLDFDYKLDDIDAGGTEIMAVEAKWDTSWHTLAELVNNGSVDWTKMHIEFTIGIDHAVDIRFRVHGESSGHISSWYIDNILFYPVCNRPVDLISAQNGHTVNLTWSPPVCTPPGEDISLIFDDGTMENAWGINPGYNDWMGNLFFVPWYGSGKVLSFSLQWWNNSLATNQDFQIDVFSQQGVPLGSSPKFQVPIPAPDTFMTVNMTNDVYFSGPFYGMVHWKNFSGFTHWLGYDQTGQYAGQNLGFYFDGTEFRRTGNSIGAPPGVFTERVNVFMTNLDSIRPAGYNIYRRDSVEGVVADFHKVNTAILNNTNYTDIINLDSLQYGFFKYFVTAIFNSTVTNTFLCESPGSDTIEVRFPVIGVEEVSGASFLLYPNPAHDFFIVKSDGNISRIELLNFLGQTVYSENITNQKVIKVNTNSLQPGVYLIRISTPKSIHAGKITIIH